MPDSGKLVDPPSAMFGNGYSMSGSFAIPMSFRFLLFPLADIFPKQRHRPHCPSSGQMQPAPCFDVIFVIYFLLFVILPLTF